ncbi:MAG: acyl-CoA synthetase [Alphaproteobacteria bacterium]|nr:acyl-CoA synthetase [Alphaproteobacteria bacterium]
MSYSITSGERVLSLDDYEREGAKAASGFRALGIGEGDAIALMTRNDIPMLVAMQGAGLIGAYSVPVNWHFTGEEAAYIIQDCDAKALLIHADLLPAMQGDIPDGLPVFIAETPPEIQAAYAIPDSAAAVPAGLTDWSEWLAGQTPFEGEPALARGSMIYTSGTTGRPKGVRREPASPVEYEEMLKLALRDFGVRPGANAAMTGPMYHSAPAAYARMALGLGTNLHLMPRFDAEELLRQIEARRLSHMHLVPTMFVRLLALPDEVRTRYDLSSLEYVIHGAAPCPPEVKRRMIEWWGPVINEYYGSTEAGLVTIATSEHALAKPGTVGLPMPGTEVRILDGEGRPQPPGVEGEIYMSITMLTDFTYHKRDDDRREIEREGLVTNGDVGFLDEDGYLFLCDRKRDMVISGGVNIYPAEIEAVLIQAPGVADCAVFGIPDDQFGESVAAAVTLTPGAAASEAAIRDYLGEHLAGYKLPRLIAFHDDLPREDSGKIFKRKLREPYWQDAGRRI